MMMKRCAGMCVSVVFGWDGMKEMNGLKWKKRREGRVCSCPFLSQGWIGDSESEREWEEDEEHGSGQW